MWRRFVKVVKVGVGALVKVVNIWEIGQGGGCGEGSPW